MARQITKLTTVFVIVLSAALLAGCNTIEGVGRDMQGLGGYVADTAEDANPYGP